MQRVKLRLADLKWMMGCCFRDVWPMISACETLLGTNKAPVGVAGRSPTHDTASVVGIPRTTDGLVVAFAPKLFVHCQRFCDAATAP
jgi:hypothetical protein